MSFANGTLIDEAFCQEMLRVKNFLPAISVEGFEEATDSRRGAGTFRRVERAMALLRGRSSVSPDEVRAVLHPVLRHRLMPNYRATGEGVTMESVIDSLM